jgi:nucleotide-binding universal stress UspA family protein
VLLGATERALGHRLLHGDALERVLRGTPCDVGIYRSV